MNTRQATLLIAKKDLKVYFRDRTGVILGFGLPIVLAVAFGFIYKMTFGREGGMSRTALWVADEDGTAESRAFVAALRESRMLSVRPRSDEDPVTAADLKEKVADGEAHHGLLIGAGYADALRSQRFPTLTMFRDPGRALEGQLVSIGLLQGFMSSGTTDLAPMLTTHALKQSGLPDEWSDRILAVSRTFSVSVEHLFVEANAAGLIADGAATGADGEDAGAAGIDFSAVMSNLVPLESVEIQPPDRPKQLTYMLSHSIAGISVMMLMFGLVACGTLLIKERDSRTIDRLLVSPVPRSSILWGKFLFTAVVGALQLVVVFTVGGVIFRVNLLKDPVTLVVICAALLFAITSFGMLVAAFSRTTAQAEGLSTIIILLMSALGGAWFPLQMFDLPAIGEVICRSTLTWWAMSAFQGMLWYGKEWTDPSVLRDVSVMIAFGVAASAAAVALFRRRYVAA